MILIIKYEELENDINVGFRKHNFIVYGSIAKELVKGLSKNQILQKVYEIIKPSMDYETERYNQGLSNSIVDNIEIEEVEEFIPEPSKVVKIEFSVDKSVVNFDSEGNSQEINLSSTLINQYGEKIIDTVEYSITHGAIKDNVLIVDSVVEPTEIDITATYGNVSKSEKVMLYPYAEPIPPEPTEEELKNKELEQQLTGLQSAMAELTMMMTP